MNDAPEDTDYNLRLCRKRSIICAGEGPHRTVRRTSILSLWSSSKTFPLTFYPCVLNCVSDKTTASTEKHNASVFQSITLFVHWGMEAWFMFWMCKIWLLEKELLISTVFFFSGLACQSRCSKSSSVSIQKQWVQYSKQRSFNS